MTTEDAKKILSFYRPGSADARDPAFADALELVRRAAENSRRPAERNPELTQWFEEHCATYAAARAKFQEIPVPPGLPQQILAERKVIPLPLPRKPVPLLWLAVAAALAALLCILPFILRRERAVSDFVACRNQMVRMALSPYFMDLETTNQDRIRAYLAERSAPANYVLPLPLAAAQIVGCGVKSWDNAPVSMICFRSGRPLRPGDSTDLWLFVIDNNQLHRAPLSDAPSFAQVSRGMTASWTRDQRTYILVGNGDKAALEKYL
jgi:hypothetical protein